MRAHLLPYALLGFSTRTTSLLLDLLSRSRRRVPPKPVAPVLGSSSDPCRTSSISAEPGYSCPFACGSHTVPRRQIGLLRLAARFRLPTGHGRPTEDEEEQHGLAACHQLSSLFRFLFLLSTGHRSTPLIRLRQYLRWPYWQ